MKGRNKKETQKLFAIIKPTNKEQRPRKRGRKAELMGIFKDLAIDHEEHLELLSEATATFVDALEEYFETLEDREPETTETPRLLAQAETQDGHCTLCIDTGDRVIYLAQSPFKDGGKAITLSVNRKEN